MRMKAVVPAIAVIVLTFTGLAAAQDFQKEYSIPANGSVSIRNVSGQIKIAGYDGATIIVTAFKDGRDQDLVEIVDMSDSNHIDIYVEYPKNTGVEASISFEIQAPRSIKYDYQHLSSVSGDVSVSEVAGQLGAESVSGNVDVLDFLGSASAHSVSGDVYVQIAETANRETMKYASVSGGVTVRAPANLNAYVEMSTLSGSLWTEFPLRMVSRWVGRTARGQLGAGGSYLKIASVSGRVALLKK